jgi:hypothetical protein
MNKGLDVDAILRRHESYPDAGLKAKLHLGAVCMHLGYWVPSYNLDTPPSEQKRLMVGLGNICKCGFVPHRCRCDK